MSTLEQAPGLVEALRGEMTPKFLATRTSAGVPNVIPVISLLPDADQPDTLFFGNFLLRKSIRNLKQDKRVGILVITPELQGWILTGDFVEFQRTGPYVERQMSGSLLRYNAYTGVRDAGVICVRGVRAAFAVTKLQVARDYVLARFAGGREQGDGGVALPLPVRKAFGQMAAIRVVAWVGEDGYPEVSPALSLQPAGDKMLVCRLREGGLPAAPPRGLVAANILTLDAVSYQAKGCWTASGKTGRLLVQEIYAGGPPYPGGRVA